MKWPFSSEDRVLEQPLEEQQDRDFDRRDFLDKAGKVLGITAATQLLTACAGVFTKDSDVWQDYREQSANRQPLPREQQVPTTAEWQQAALDAQSKVQGVADALVALYSSGTPRYIGRAVNETGGHGTWTRNGVTLDWKGPYPMEDASIVSLRYGRDNWDDDQNPEQWQTFYRADYLVPRFTDRRRRLGEILGATSTKLFVVHAATADRREAKLSIYRGSSDLSTTSGSVNSQVQTMGIEGVPLDASRLDTVRNVRIESPIIRMEEALGVALQAASDLRLPR